MGDPLCLTPTDDTGRHPERPSERDAFSDHVAACRERRLAERHTYTLMSQATAPCRTSWRGKCLDFARIDGVHDFGNVFIDFVCGDKLLKPGGIVGFNDVVWPDFWACEARDRA